ncbi:mannose-1-phosphate guanylyltransferase [Candidatus Uhrbacteria bacterium]|nr:mannose-1-phosphate guanylyltransferase [Candidatus Uhrbacteria bacterium]
MLYAIIMAGGVGTRLWPVSTKGKPKQVYPLLDDETLLQKTWKRLRRGFPAKNIFVATSEGLAEEVARQLGAVHNPPQPSLTLREGAKRVLPLRVRGSERGLRGVLDQNLILEPARRGTAPALGLALLKIAKRDPNGIFVFVNADNFVRKEDEFVRLLRVAERVIKKKPDHTLLIGVNPTYPETGYGYIKMGKPVLKFTVHRSQFTVFEVEKFVEKPDLQTARKFLRRWEYLWNPTLVIARVDHFLGLYKKHLPKMWRQLQKGEFSKIKAETIDYGILEHETKMLVLPGNFGWTDVGHWRAVHEVLAGNIRTKELKNIRTKGNICKAGKCVSVDSSGNLIYSLSGKLVALAGVQNMILIESENALLLCPKSRAQDVKKLVENLEKKGLKEYL